MPLRIVLDTNVLVSGLLNPRGAPGRIVDMILMGEVQILYDDRILLEYHEALRRPRFGFEERDIRRVLDYLTFSGEAVAALPIAFDMPDESDLPFIEVAVSGQADALVTGNVSHFASVENPGVMTPTGFLEFWAASSNRG